MTNSAKALLLSMSYSNFLPESEGTVSDWDDLLSAQMVSEVVDGFTLTERGKQFVEDLAEIQPVSDASYLNRLLQKNDVVACRLMIGNNCYDVAVHANRVQDMSPLVISGVLACQLLKDCENVSL